jgi:large subunit ribosomal protein L4
LHGGGKAHGPVPRDFSFSINEKVRLMAMKSLLTAKLYEERIILINSESIEYPKTKYLNEILAPFKQDKLLFLTDFDIDKNFKLAS